MTNTMKTYTIPQNQNYCREWWRKRPLYKTTVMVCKVKLTPSCLIDSGYYGWQKICGFSRGYHHAHSFRIAWRYLNGLLQIGAYQYSNGVRSVRIIDTLRKFELPELNCMISFCDEVGMVRYAVNDAVPILLPADLQNLPSWGYSLHPYYENPQAEITGAPHEIKIHLETKFIR